MGEAEFTWNQVALAVSRQEHSGQPATKGKRVQEEGHLESSEERLSRLESYIEHWVSEKAQHVLEGIVGLYEELNRREDLPKACVEALQDHLGPLVWDTLKILCFATDKEWTVEDVDRICEQGRSGLEEVLVHLGLLHEAETGESRRRAEIQSVLGDLEELRMLLSETRYPARTKIHELLYQLRIQDPLVGEVSDLTERVTVGELTWGEYADSVIRLTDKLLAKYREVERQLE